MYFLIKELPTVSFPPGVNDVSTLVWIVLIAVARFEKLELIVTLDPAILSLPRISVIDTVAILFVIFSAFFYISRQEKIGGEQLC